MFTTDTLLKLDHSTRKKRRQWAWTRANEARASDVNRVVNEFEEYWPITERLLYYRIISTNLIKQAHWRKHNNAKNEMVDVYSALGPLLKWMRIDGLLPWEVIADETRILTAKVGFSSAKAFIRQETDEYLSRYKRCVAQDQEYHIEIWIEKYALLRIVEPVADEFCRRVLCCRGYNSVTFQADFYSRTMRAIDLGLKPVVLYFGDWDPSGVNMIYAAMQTLHDELGLDENTVEFHRCGINPEHFSILHENPEPLKAKTTDSRTKDFIRKHGPTCYELDAFHPKQLKQLVRDSIIRFTDTEAVACNAEIENQDLGLIYNLKAGVHDYVDEQLRLAQTFYGDL